MILDIGAFSFYYLRYNPRYQVEVLLITSLAYVAWGIIHHISENDIHLKVILEYLLIALLVNFVVLSLLFRA